MLGFPEQMLLLLFDGRRFVNVPARLREFALAGSVLMELALANRIDTDPERLFLIDRSPLHDDVVDPTLARIAASGQTHDTRYWIERMAPHASDIRARCLARLTARGILRRDGDRLAWSRCAGAASETRQRLAAVLRSDEIPGDRDIVLISLAAVCGIFRGTLSDPEYEELAPRIGQVARMDLIAREVASAVRDIEATVSQPRVPMLRFLDRQVTRWQPP